ncbi:MAG: hypothetical protein LBQ50_03835 [Planctomycetaceae bacterium]|jgi:hypothetical protein|nr:hypothetical protein [Planctomycetaceae bacterium]
MFRLNNAKGEMTMLFRNFSRFLVLWCILTISISTVFGQENVVNEKTVYIPYEKLRKIFEQPGRGVFVPYDEFKALWDAAKATQTVKPIDVAPVDAMITETFGTATIAEEVVRVESTLSIELLKDGWHEIPLRLADAAITKAQIGDEKAKILGGSDGGYRLLVEKKKTERTENNERKTERLELTLHYAKRIEKSPGRNSVSFEVPQSPLGRWKIIVPESGVKIDFTPLVAAAEQTKSENETIFEAFVGATPKIQIAWTPKAEGATGLDALTSVQLLQQTTIDESILRTSARFDYTISRAAISNLAIQIPKDQKVVGVFDPNIRKWSVEQKDDAQTIRIELFEPAKERQTVQLELEKLRNNKEPKIIVPNVSATDTERQQGILIIRTADELSTETVTSTGLLRMDASELPESLRKSSKTSDAAYRIPSTSYNLELEVNKVEPRVTATAQINLRLSASWLQMEMLTMFDIEKAGIFQVSFEIPSGYQHIHVTGSSADFHNQNQQAVYSYQPVQVDSFVTAPVVDNAPTQTLTVNFKRKAIGKVGLRLFLNYIFSKPDLESPTGKSVDLPVILPTLGKGLAEKFDGKLLLLAETAFRVNPVDTEGLQLISLQQLQSPVWHLETHNAQLGFLVADSAAKLTLRAERRQPQLTLRELRTVRIEDGSIKHGAKFYYEILFSGVKSLRIDVPEKLSGRLNILRSGKGTSQNNAADWRELMIVPQPEDVAEGYVAWEFATKSNLFGSGVLELGWEDELTQLEVGKRLPVDIPRLLPKKQQSSDRFWGQILVSKSQSIDIGESETIKGLKPIDPQYDVSEQDRISDAVAAFEFHDDWSLQLMAVRYKLEEVKRTSIELGLIRANLSFSKFGTEISAQALFRIRSVQQRLELAMPSDSKIDDIRINGQSVVLESDNSAGATPRFMIPLTSVPPDTPFLLDIRYGIAPDSQERMEIPFFPGSNGSPSPAVQKIYLAAYVPEEWAVTGYKGNWSKNFSFYRNSEVTGVDNQPNVSSLRTELLGGLSDDFSVGGTPYLFSTLHPREGEPLHLSGWKDLQIGLVLFAVIVINGLYLLLYSWTRRFQIAIGLVILCILIGFVCPTLTMLLSVKSTPGWGILIVTVCWGLQAAGQGFSVWRKNRAKNQPAVSVSAEERSENHDA